MARFGAAEAALDAVPMLARRGGGDGPRIPDPALIAREIEAVARLGAACPAGRGRISAAARRTRHRAARADRAATSAGASRRGGAGRRAQCLGRVCRFARGLAQDLAAQHVPVTSGLARGSTPRRISARWRAARSASSPAASTSPSPENARLQEEVATRGLLIAEQPPGTQPLARHFLAQPDHRRTRARDRGGRGRAAFGLADHRAAGGRGGARGDGGARPPGGPARKVATC
jgi:DNA processing protein